MLAEGVGSVGRAIGGDFNVVFCCLLPVGTRPSSYVSICNYPSKNQVFQDMSIRTDRQ